MAGVFGAAGQHLIDRLHHGFEGQHHRTMPRFVFCNRLQDFQFAPFACGGRRLVFQHGAHLFSHFMQLGGGLSHHMPGHHRRPGEA